MVDRVVRAVRHGVGPRVAHPRQVVRVNGIQKIGERRLERARRVPGDLERLVRPAHRMFGRQLLRGQLHLPAPELRHALCERHAGFALPQCLLRFSPRGHVVEVERQPLFRGKRVHFVPFFVRRIVGGEIHRPAFPHAALVLLLKRRAHQCGKRGEEIASEHLLPALLTGLLRRAIHKGDPPVAIDGDEGRGEAVQGRGQPLRRFPRADLCPLACGDIDQEPHYSLHLTAGPAIRHKKDQPELLLRVRRDQVRLILRRVPRRALAASAPRATASAPRR